MMHRKLSVQVSDTTMMLWKAKAGNQTYLKEFLIYFTQVLIKKALFALLNLASLKCMDIPLPSQSVVKTTSNLFSLPLGTLKPKNLVLPTLNLNVCGKGCRVLLS